MRNLVIAIFIAIMIAHVFGLMFSWYYYSAWFDIPMHIAGGVFVALLFLYVFDVRWHDLPEEWWKVVLFTLGAVALVGVLWEFYEYLYDVFVAGRRYFFENQIRGLFDTLKDLFNDLVGGAVTALVYVKLRSRLKSRNLSTREG